MSRDHLELGRRGEQLALAFLKKARHKILVRNYSCPIGEIDLITLSNGTLCFVEIKTRHGIDVSPEELVPRSKQRKIARIARRFVATHRMEAYPCRFDVLTVEIDESDRPNLRHYPNAFEIP